MAKEDVKFTRKELKEDELVTFSAKALKWLEANRRPVLTTIVGVIVVIFLYYAITGFISYRAEKASNEYIEASELLIPKEKENPSSNGPSKEDLTNALKKFEEIYNKYGFTGVGRISLLRMAQISYQIQDYEKSLKYTKDFISKVRSDDPLYKSALLLLANVSYARKEYSEALKACDDILKGSSDFLKDEALYISSKAFIKEGKKEEAKNRLKELVEKYPNSHLKEEASELLKGL